MITITPTSIFSDQGAVAHHVSGQDWAVAHRPHELLDRDQALIAVLSTIPAWQDRSLTWPPRRPDIPDARPQGETDMARARDLSTAERQELTGKLKDLTDMLDEYEDGPHLLAATENLLKKYGQI